MKTLRRVSVLLGVVTVVAGALTVGFAGSASAAGSPPWEPNSSSVGGLIFYNAAGQQITGGNLTDSPIAAYVEGTATIRAGDTKATLYGYLPVFGETPGQWSGESLGSSTTYPNASAPAPLNTATLPVETGSSGDETVAQLEVDFPNADTSNDGYAGIYELRLETSANAKPANLTYDSADIEITGSTWSVIYPAPTLTGTTTSLGTVPASPQVAGTSVQLNATVSPAAPGTVQFEDGTTPIGSPVTVVAGAASISTTSLPVGAPDTLNAVFTPAQFSAYSGSTGTTTFTVTAPPAAGTTTGLGVNPSTAAADTSVSITADVTLTSNSTALAAGTGQIQFYDDGTDTSGDITNNSLLLGTVSLGTGGIASLPYSSFAQGAHNLVAVFQPTNSGTYSTSTSLPVLFTATAPAIAPDPQPLTVNIPQGSLVITTPYTVTNPFSLGTAVLDPTDSKYTASAAFGNSNNPSDGVTITDTRAGDLPWTASATVTNFTDGSGGIINGQNLTFTGVTPYYISGNALQAPDVVPTNVPNSAIYAPSTSGSDGLYGGPHQFASATAGEGSVYIGGLLTLTAPTSTPAGTYTATLTFTII